jgi:VWFA-related protein
MVRWAAILLTCLAVPMTLASQSAPENSQLRISTHLVQFGVIVRDARGPLGNLTKDDFVVLDRGKPQKISIFSAEPGEAGAQSAKPLLQNTYSDQAQFGGKKPRSVTIVLLDNLNTLSGSSPMLYEDTPSWLEDLALANAKRHLIEFLEHLNPNDRIAIYGLTNSLHVLCDFTCSRDQLLAVVNKYDTTSKTKREAVEPGNYHTGVPGNFDESINSDVRTMAALNNEARAQATMSALTAIAAHVAEIPEQKNLLWLTANLPVSGHAVAQVLGRANIVAYPVDARGLLPRGPLLDISQVTGADENARGGIGSSPAMTPQPIGIDAMEQMADDTGGRAFVNSNDLTGVIREVVENSAATYTLGFYLDAGAADGKFHKLRVEVKRTGLSMTYPKGYFAFKDVPATQDESRNSFLAAIRSPLDSSAIPLEVKVDSAGQSATRSLQIAGTVGIKGIPLAQNGAMRRGILDVYTIEQDDQGNVLHQTNNRLNLNLTEQQYQADLQSGVLFHKSVEPGKATTVLRVLVQLAGTAEVGSVIIPLTTTN